MAGSLGSTGSTTIARRRKNRSAGREFSSPPMSRRSSASCARPLRPHWSVISSTCPRAILDPPSSSRRFARRATSLARGSVTSGKELAEGYPLIAAVGAAATETRAPRLIELEWGKPRSACRDHRQGRLLRQRRSRPQARLRHAADEEGHGRSGPCACARAPRHRREDCPSGSSFSSPPSRMPFRETPTGPVT